MEFGSDFHTIENPPAGKSLPEYFPEANLYASGRQALLALAAARGWKRLWVPSYFCEESLECLAREGIGLVRYNVTPLSDPAEAIGTLSPAGEDGLMVVNYFGLYGRRAFRRLDCEIVEDHTHDLIGDWACNSSADWCIASLRKTLPVADGGILYSPKRNPLPPTPALDRDAENIMSRRAMAMNLKRDFLNGLDIDKNEFLRIFRETELEFDTLPLSAISPESRRIVENLDLKDWYVAKGTNWSYLSKRLEGMIPARLCIPENPGDTPFSFTLLFDDKRSRDRFRENLIRESVYPAILWSIGLNADPSAKSFGERILSLHCDARYTLADMEEMCDKIEKAIV